MARPLPGAAKVCQFKVALRHIEPEIWRIIEVPESYTFWDLHVAIQDAMGWLDCHLHEFTPAGMEPFRGPAIGVPESESDETYVAGWELSLKPYFDKPSDSFLYRYDFGDDWEHEVTLLATKRREPGVRYPAASTAHAPARLKTAAEFTAIRNCSKC